MGEYSFVVRDGKFIYVDENGKEHRDITVFDEADDFEEVVSKIRAREGRARVFPILPRRTPVITKLRHIIDV